MKQSSQDTRVYRAPRRAVQDEQARVLGEALRGVAIDAALPYAPQVQQALREAIVSLRLMPGTPLSEAAVAGVLGLSRTPVREALRDLQTVGLIDIFPQAGTVVSPIRIHLIKQEVFVREALEGANLLDVMKSLDTAGGSRLQALIETQRRDLDRGDVAAFFANDEAMHRLFFEFTGRLPVWTLVNQAKQHIDRARLLLTRDNLALCRVAFEEHEVLARALLERDDAALRAALHVHVESVAEAVLAYHHQSPSNWFVD